MGGGGCFFFFAMRMTVEPKRCSRHDGGHAFTMIASSPVAPASSAGAGHAAHGWITPLPFAYLYGHYGKKVWTTSKLAYLVSLYISSSVA